MKTSTWRKLNCPKTTKDTAVNNNKVERFDICNSSLSLLHTEQIKESISFAMTSSAKMHLKDIVWTLCHTYWFYSSSSSSSIFKDIKKPPRTGFRSQEILKEWDLPAARNISQFNLLGWYCSRRWIRAHYYKQDSNFRFKCKSVSLFFQLL